MRHVSIALLLFAVADPFHSASRLHAQAAEGARTSAARRPGVVLENARVRVYRLDGHAASPVEHGGGVVVSLDGKTPGDARWEKDAAAPSRPLPSGTYVIVQPLDGAPPTAPAAASRPGGSPFTGMSFKPVFDNDRVSVIRARMDVGAREAVHTHASDTIVVHLSGGEIEDTADGKTVVNRWSHGDVEFEALGSSHSARNVGAAVDVVLVALKSR